jgi:hypothetical protein
VIVVAAVAVKEAEELPPTTATEAGTVSAVEELVSATAAAPALVNVTVQAALAAPERLAGKHDNPVTWAGATSESAADLELPLSDAVTVTV